MRFRKLLLLTSLVLAITLATLMVLRPAIQGSNTDFQTMHGTNNVKSSDFKPVTHKAWNIKEVEYVPEYKIDVVTYTHIKTGGELVSIHWDKSENTNPREQEKVFGIFFRTPISDSTGVPHILEHSVLCGSRKFKTKEPFASIRQKSLNTFLNAFTWPDRTGFAFASCNTQDFYNSLDVYLDAVFHPRVRTDKFVLAQEGWHLKPKKEVNSTDLKDVELEYSGVVYSEMKGVYSDSDSLLYRRLRQHTFPDTGYTFDSGGDPAIIPSLTFEHFAEFYDKYYHPTNARSFVSGMDHETEAEFLSRVDNYYNEYDAAPEKKQGSVIPMQTKKFTEPLRKEYPYPIDKEKEMTHMIAINWLINDTPLRDVEELAWSVLNYLLLGTSSSILFKTLSESGLGTQVLDYGLESGLVQYTFAVGMKGVTDVVKVEQLILDTLGQIAKNGFEHDTIESSLNFIEFQLRENESGGEPKGLDFIFASMSKYNYDYSPTQGIQFEKSLFKLKSNIQVTKSKIFQDLIVQYLLDNTHRVIIDFYPSTTYEADKLQEEEDRVNEYKNGLSEEELRGIIEFAEELLRKQATPDSEEDIATIPTITLKDVNPTVIEYPNDVEENAFGLGVTIVSHTLPTAGILYADIGIDISKLSFSVAAEKLPLYMAFMTETGTEVLSEVKLRELIEMHTGGVSISTLISQVRDSTKKDMVVLDGSKWVTKLLVQGKALAHKSDKLFEIYLAILNESKLDKQNKAIELLKSSCTSKESSIGSSGNRYALRRLNGRYNVAGAIREKMEGVTSYEDCKGLLKQVQEDWAGVLKDLEEIRATIMDKPSIGNGLIINLTGDKETLKMAQPGLRKFIQELVGQVANPQEGSDLLTQHPWVKEVTELNAANQDNPNEALILSTQVSYVVKGNKVYDVGEKVHGSSSVVTSWLSTVYLWNTVRIQGNAYGAGATLDSDGGVFACVSYRDPNIQSTLNFYDGVVPWIKEQVSEFKNKPKELESAIIGAISNLDGSPPSNSQKGTIAFHRWLLGYTTESRQTWRNEILNTKPEDFEQFAKRLEKDDYSTVIVTSDALFDGAKLGDENFVKVEI